MHILNAWRIVFFQQVLMLVRISFRKLRLILPFVKMLFRFLRARTLYMPLTNEKIF